MCEACAKMMFGQAMSVAKCGHGTSRIGMMWCEACGRKHGVCEACGKPIGAASPADGEDPPPHTD